MSESPVDETGKRSSKARERQRRRRERQTSQAQAAGGTRRSRSRQLESASRRLNLPKVDPRLVRPVLFGVGGVGFMLALIFAVGLFTGGSEPALARNALWIGQEWTYQTHERDAVQDFIDRLERNQIGTVYARVSELNFDGTWTGRPESGNNFSEVEGNVAAFAEQFKALAPDRNLYGTIYFRADIGEEDNYRLDSTALHEVVANFASRTVNGLGFDGVLLVVEPVWDGDEAYLDLLRTVRSRIGKSPGLAVTVPPDWTPTDVDVPTTPLIAPGTVWSREYKQRVALIGVDQIVVQAYNSYLTGGDAYADWMVYQVQTFAEAIGDLGTSTRVLVGVPTYESSPPAHDERVENVASAVDGIKRGLEAAGEFSSAIQGAALYAAWDTSESEWEQFNDLWVNR